MNATSPPILSIWSGPPAPECCLASKSPVRKCSEKLQNALETRLKMNLLGRGSMIYRTVWKPHATPLGRQIYRLRASAVRTSDSEHYLGRSGWTTPRATDGTNGGPNQSGGALPADAAGIVSGIVSGWWTPMTQSTAGNSDFTRKTEAVCGRDIKGHGLTLSCWATPTTRDHKDTGDLEMYVFGSKTGRIRDDSTSTQAYLAGWPTPTKGNADGSQMAKGASATGRRPDGSKATVSLNQVSQLATHGETSIGYHAGTGKSGQLDPAHSRWLMGYPPAWDDCAVTAMPSTRKRRQNSSAPLMPLPATADTDGLAQSFRDMLSVVTMSPAQQITYTLCSAAGVDATRAALVRLPPKQTIDRAATRAAMRKAINDAES